MPEEVRSDFDIALKLRTPAGQTLEIGRHHSPEHTSTMGEPLAIAHLHRVDPTGGMLASFDADKSEIQLRSLVGDAATIEHAMSHPTVVEVKGLVGVPTQIRWLRGDAGFVVTTTEDTFLVPHHTQAGGTVAQAQPVLGHDTAIKRVTDTRVTDGGFIAQTIESVDGDEWMERKQVYFVRVADDLVQDIEPLVHGKLDLQIANLRSDGRIVMVVDDIDDDDGMRLVTVRPRVDGPVERLESVPCASGDGSWCEVVNWTPDTVRLGYATWDGTVVLERPAAAPLLLPIGTDPEADWEGNIHTLWANADEQRIFAANDKRVRMWDAAGATLWSWKPRGKKLVKSAQFTWDGQAVLASVDRTIVRVDQGKARTIVRESMPKRRFARDGFDWTRRVYIDDVQPLPGGAVAYMVVDSRSRVVGWEEMESEAIDAELVPEEA